MIVSYCANDICSRNYGDLTVIYDLRSKIVLKLEAVAADIWNYVYLKNNVTFEDIVSYIMDIYECDKESVEDDIEAFLSELYNLGVVQFNHEYILQSEPSAERQQKEMDDFEGQIIQEVQNRGKLYSVTFEMTYDCNENCVHCYAHYPNLETPKRIISVKEYKKVLDELYDMQCMHLSFTGGDPFVYKGFLDVYFYARQKGFVCDIFTNLQYLHNHPEALIPIVSKRPRAFYVSLYGATAETHDSVTGIPGSFEKTLEVVKSLKNHGISVVFNVMILTLNHSELDEIIALCKKLGAEYRVSMSLIYTNDGNSSPMNYFVKDKSVIKRVLRTVRNNIYSMDVLMDDIQPSKYMCGAGVSSLSIAPDGTVFPCISLKIPLGSVLTDRIQDIWDGPKRVQFMESFKWKNTTECNNCSYQKECPHCAGMSQAETGDCFSCNTCDKIIAECLGEL